MPSRTPISLFTSPSPSSVRISRSRGVSARSPLSTGAQGSSSGLAVEIVQQHDNRRRVAVRPLLEEHRKGQLRLGSGTEHDDVGTALTYLVAERLERVGRSDEE